VDVKMNRKTLFWIMLLVLVLVVVVGCTTQATAPSSTFVGGGC